MNILICDLGLIGASLAKTLKKNTNHTVLGWNRTESVTEKALRDGVIDKTGDIDSLMAKPTSPLLTFIRKPLFLLFWSTKTALRKTAL